MTDRLAELEAKALALSAEISALRAIQPAPPPRPPKDEGVVRVEPLFTESTGGMPTLKELEKLFAAVKHLAPWPLQNKHDDQRPFRGFCSSFRWLANKGRIEQPNPRFAFAFWLDNCRGWLRERNVMVNDIDASTLILAMYAQGDVKYVPALGHVWELGLAEHSGKPAADGWKRIIREGASAILPPSAPARRDAPLNPVRIVSGW
jgi:hypothetical protein